MNAVNIRKASGITIFNNFAYVNNELKIKQMKLLVSKLSANSQRFITKSNMKKVAQIIHRPTSSSATLFANETRCTIFVAFCRPVMSYILDVPLKDC